MRKAAATRVFAAACVMAVAGALTAHWASGAPARVAEAPREAQECTMPLPPPVDTARYFGTTPGTSWLRVLEYMDAADIDFDYGEANTLSVRLCGDTTQASCDPFVIRVQSESSNICLGKETAEDGGLRMLARLSVPARFPVPPSVGALWGFTAQNTARTVYLLLRHDTAFGMYEADGVTRFTYLGTWNFFFCSDGMTSEYAQAQWRPDSLGFSTPAPGRGAGAGAGTGTELASYGWMSCLSGCCRFYGSPPPPTDPDPDGQATRRAAQMRRETLRQLQQSCQDARARRVQRPAADH